jgi:hypothetical protein
MSSEMKVRRTLRHPDGSPDIAAYRKIAHHERQAAIVSAVRETMRILFATPSILARALGRPGRIQLNAPPQG